MSRKPTPGQANLLDAIQRIDGAFYTGGGTALQRRAIEQLVNRGWISVRDQFASMTLEGRAAISATSQ